MEVQVILNDVAGIMDVPFGDGSLEQQLVHYNHTTKLNSWASSISPKSSSPVILAEGSGCDRLNWSKELKFVLNNFKTATQGMVQNGASGISLSGLSGRKRKMWDDVDTPASKVVHSGTNQPQQVFGDDSQMVIPDLTIGDASSAKILATLARFKNGKLQHNDQNKDRAEDDTGSSGGVAGRMTNWHMDDIAADLDGSLSGLGVDLNTAPYNMNEALLALPSLPVFKEEAPSPTSNNDNTGLQQTAASSNNNNNNSSNNTNGTNSGGRRVEADTNAEKASDNSTPLHQLLQQHGSNGNYGNLPTSVLSGQSAQNPQLEATGSVSQAIGNTTTTLSQCESFQNMSNTSGSFFTQKEAGIDCRFQYVLAAATSIATKMNEETLTYLNQGQSYEIKLKKLGELSAYRGKILKTLIRICFHERRLQYMEREQMAAWQASRPGDRIVEVDIPLSYGIYEVVQDQYLLNTVEFLWDPTKEVGVYIKVNCISTEFTPKKHGGEKGVPFRIQVETYLQAEGSLKRLHAAACQIKVFKLKGADRKHKQDREKILKRPPLEQEKFQPSYECTVLNDIPLESLGSPPLSPAVTSSNSSPATICGSQLENHGNQPRISSGTQIASSSSGGSPALATKEEPNNPHPLAFPAAGSSGVLPDTQPLPNIAEVPVYLQPLANEATSQQTAQWLQNNRFGSYLRVFASFSGADILRLSRDDLIQICGLPDGIRLFNALHSKAIAPRLTLYLCVEQSTVYHALYLDTLTCNEMMSKLAQLMGITSDQIHDIYIQGPNAIHVLITDDVVRNIKDESMFTIEILQDESGERYRLLLKPASR